MASNGDSTQTAHDDDVNTYDYDDDEDYGENRFFDDDEYQVSRLSRDSSLGNFAATSTRLADTSNLTKSIIHKMSDKSDRATTEQVLDPRTRMILFKMLNRNVFSEIHGCVSTGKEANVYHACTEDGQHRAIKVYKTSILVFKDRDRYVTGEYRFRHGYSKHNPRKMVKVWAEKEMRNLKRIRNAGIPSPEPLLLKLHVLVMEFLGDSEGRAAPRLKDAVLTTCQYRECYRQLIRLMWVMYNVCRLVHADLSEYNILFHQKQLYIIDVSQSVEHEHPHAHEFLRKDCTNVTDYFKKRGVEVLTVRQLFTFVTNDTLAKDLRQQQQQQQQTAADTAAMVRGSENLDDMPSTLSLQQITPLPPLVIAQAVDDELDRLQSLVEEQQQQHESRDDLNALQVEEEVFKRAWIPRTLDEVVNWERDIVDVVNRGRASELVYADLLRTSEKPTAEDAGRTAKAAQIDALLQPKPQTPGHRAAEDNGHAVEETVIALSDFEMSGSGDEDSDGSSDESDSELAQRGKKHEDKDAKKERKKAAKDAAREKRKHKMPKAVKKRKEKQNKK
ncbi:Serine/threonine-protein kinase rio1 [Sorochytrium milnesiophthora]